MSSAHDAWRKLLRFLDENPEIDTGLELTINVLSSLGPLAVAALVILTNSKEPTTSDFMSAFLSFFEKGELALLILSMSGAIIWLVTIKTIVANIVFRAFFSVFSIFVLTYVGVGIISGNHGFAEKQHEWVLNLLWWLYLASLLVWAIVSIVSKRNRQSDPPSGSMTSVSTAGDLRDLDTAIAASKKLRGAGDVS